MSLRDYLLLKELRDFGSGPIVGLIISLFTVPTIARAIPPAEFGKSSLFTLSYMVFNLVALLGFHQAFVKYFNVEGINRKVLLSVWSNVC
jgi:O-antigen/teichoic acid export membrane protein